jgi:hypothetical protein
MRKRTLFLLILPKSFFYHWDILQFYSFIAISLFQNRRQHENWLVSYYEKKEFRFHVILFAYLNYFFYKRFWFWLPIFSYKIKIMNIQRFNFKGLIFLNFRRFLNFNLSFDYWFGVIYIILIINCFIIYLYNKNLNFLKLL